MTNPLILAEQLQLRFQKANGDPTLEEIDTLLLRIRKAGDKYSDADIKRLNILAVRGLDWTAEIMEKRTDSLLGIGPPLYDTIRREIVPVRPGDLIPV